MNDQNHQTIFSPFAQHAPAEGKDHLLRTAQDLMEQSAAERQAGNLDAAEKLLQAAAPLLGQQPAPAKASRGRPQTPNPDLDRVTALLRAAWHTNVSLATETNLPKARITTLINQIRSRRIGLQTQKITQYKLPAEES